MRRLDMHRLQELVRLHRQGKSKRESARLLGMGRNTLRRYLAAFDEGGLLDGDPEELPRLEVLRQAVDARLPTQPALQTSSTVDAWAGAIGEMAERGARPKAIFDALRLSDPDFDGSLDAVKRSYRRWRKEQPASAAMDRLLHHATVIEIDGESYRNPKKPRKRKRAAGE